MEINDVSYMADAGGARYGDFGIGSATVGISKEGMNQYIEQLHIDLLKNVKEKIDDVENLETQISSMWQGASRDNFLRDFKQQRILLESQLEKEFLDLQNRLVEIEEGFFMEDQNLYELESSNY